MRETKYGRAVLEPVVATSTTLAEVIRRFELPATGGNYRNISKMIRLAGLDTSHFGAASYRARIASLERSELEALVKRASSLAAVLKQLGLPHDGRAAHVLRHHLETSAIDTSHFRGKGWARGETRTTHASIDHVVRRISLPNDKVFVENSPLTGGQKLVKRLLALGWTYACMQCGISEWRARPLSLHLDHINGVHNDNRLANLRLLCPNCHSQTDTYCRRGR